MRHGVINSDRVVELFENGEIKRLVDCEGKSMRYCEDVVENWVSNVIPFPATSTVFYDPYQYQDDPFTLKWEGLGLSYEGTIQSASWGCANEQ